MESLEQVARETNLLAVAREDPAAFGELFRAVWPALVQKLARQTFCPEVAADIASETFARAVVRCRQFDPARGTARGWLWSIAQNELRSWLRHGVVSTRAQRRIGFRAPVSSEDLDELLDIAAADAWHDALRSALAVLTPDSRRLVRLRVIDDLSYREIAAQFGCTEGAARVRFGRAIGALRNALGDIAVDTAWP